jgi:hypothetical protein
MARMTQKEQDELLENLKKQFEIAKETLNIERDLSFILEKQNQSLSSYASSKKSIAETQRRINLAESGLNKLIEKQKELQSLIGGLSKKRAAEAKKELENLNKIIDATQDKLRLDKQDLEVLNNNLNIYEAIGNELKTGVESLAKQHFHYKGIWDFLQKIDGGIRSMQLSMGITGERAEDFRRQMEGAANIALRFGVEIEQIAQMQSTLNEITGRANVLSESQVANMILVAKGTGMASEEAAAFLGNMMNIGSSITDATSFIEGTVNQTAKLGLNSSTVLKGITSNIGKLNSFRFQNGVEGLKQMVQEATKFNMSMENAFSAAEKFRTLEGLLETGAQLRVLGGEFAKMDEFKLSFLARNKPQEFTKELANLTKGMATFNKTTGEFDVSDIDMDRLRAVAEVTGQDFNKLVESTKKLSQVNLARRQIIGGTEADREMIANLATFQKGSNIATIKIDGKDFKVNELTDTQIGLLRQQEKTLKQRAEDSQNFNETLNNTIMQLKSTLLPLLEYINGALKWFNNIMEGWRESTGKMKSIAAILPIGGLLIGGSVGLGLLKTLISFLKGGGSIFGGNKGISGTGSQLIGAGKGAMYSGLGSAASMAAMGVAAVGIGTGFMLAAKGATSLAEAFAKLKPEQISGINTALFALGATMVGIVAIAPFIGMAAVPLLAFGGAVAMVGAGVGLAAAGIAEIVKASNGINFSGLEGVDFENIDKLKVLQNFKQSDVDRMNEMFDVLNQINSIDTAKLDSLQKLFANSTLKVQLEGNPTINNNITVEVDGEKFYKRVEKMIPIVVKKGVMPK